MFQENEKVLAIGDNLRTDIKGANNLKFDCIYISEGVHRDEYKDDLELENLLKKYNVKANFYQKKLNGRMKIYNNTNINLKHKKAVVAIGNFDGLHLGHQKVINEAKIVAKKFKLPFGVITFEPMPAMFFKKKIKNHRINSLNQKKNGFKKLKLDFLIIIKFNKKFSSLTAEEFIEKIIYKKINCKYLYISRNFKFGFKRKRKFKYS